MEDKNYDEAEKLCLEKANAEETWHYHSSDPEDWNNKLSLNEFTCYATNHNTIPTFLTTTIGGIHILHGL